MLSYVFSEAGKIKNTKLEFYDLKPSEFKESTISGLLCLKTHLLP